MQQRRQRGIDRQLCNVHFVKVGTGHRPQPGIHGWLRPGSRNLFTVQVR
jgi:hypothetical protein